MVFQEHVRFYLDMLYAFYRCLRCLGLRILLPLSGHLPPDRNHRNGANSVSVASDLPALPSPPGNH